MPTSISAYGPIDGWVDSSREVIHSQNTGSPTHSASAPISISAIRPARVAREAPFRSCPRALIYKSVSRYTYECGGIRDAPPIDPCRTAGADARSSARGGGPSVRGARFRRGERRSDRHRGGLLARCLLLELRVEGTAVRRASSAACVRALPRDGGGGQGAAWRATQPARGRRAARRNPARARGP